VLLNLIRVRPAPGTDAQFARWAIAQDPPVTTVSHCEFGVPGDLYTEMPEELLVGSLINGHPYRSPLVEEAQTAASQEREGIPGEPLPEVPEHAYPPGAQPLPYLPATEPEQLPTPEPTAGYVCDVCGRTFTTNRGRNSHRRQVHPEGGN
jgi:hypothetical protein